MQLLNLHQYNQYVPIRYFADVPPGFENARFLYLSTMFSLLLIVLLAMEWLWRLCWEIYEKPSPIRHPTTAIRVIMINLLLGTLIRILPNLAWMGLWKDLDPHGRWFLMQLDAVLDTVSFIPFSVAWVVAYLGGPMLVYQLNRHPLPLDLWPTFRQIARPLKIGVGVFIIAFAVAYLR